MIYIRYISEFCAVFDFYERLTKEDVFVILLRSSHRIIRNQTPLITHMLGYNTPPFTGSHAGNGGNGNGLTQ